MRKFYSVKYEVFSESEQVLLGLADVAHLVHAVFVEVELLSFHCIIASDVTFLSHAQKGSDALAVVAQSFNECVSRWFCCFFHFNNYTI